ncbi:hypothetical protein HR060_16840 [Catenovulum sp. SM1970]|uniref:hypothetical protein n=1 Tax=Marinifaba aquimaris TaxID=2741323 RepID=UPI0015730D1A|nr:hypothetical protein [Marinifaba aquimaris]NTS78511.1 hypothetical protein [Marinifaba aquimaris]
MKYLAALLLSLCCSVASAAEQCLQDPLRVKPCNHQVYRSIATDDPTSPHNKVVTCICVPDFIDLIKPTESQKQAYLKKYQLEDIAIKYKLSKADLVQLLTGK